ncbi:dihydrofolate reductase-like protein, partial [Trifolium pratense]
MVLNFCTVADAIEVDAIVVNAVVATCNVTLVEFPNGKFPAGGKSDIESIFPPPYFEWFQFDKDFTEYTNLDECISYLTEYIIANGPFDGFLGFSQ